MTIDTSFYTLLDTTLNKQDEIILNRVATDRKMQSAAIKSFLAWGNKFEALSETFLNRKVTQSNFTDKQLSGEKNLARLRFFSLFWKENAKKTENLNFNSVKDLKSEKDRISIAVKRLQAFRQELGGTKLNVESIDNKITKNDQLAFQKLFDAIDKLQAKARLIDLQLEKFNQTSKPN